MKLCSVCRLLLLATGTALGQQTKINPQLRTTVSADQRIVIISVTPHFVTTIGVPETVNSVVIGDPELFQAEHSDHEPELVFVKSLTTQSAESNLLISTTKGRQFSFLLVSHGPTTPSPIDFLFRYQRANGFLIEPEALPFATVSQTVPLEAPARLSSGESDSPAGPSPPQHDPLDELLERQKRAPLPLLFGSRVESDDFKGDRLRAGISEVIDGGQQVLVRFSVVDTSPNPILLMTPQVQLGGKEKTGKLLKRKRLSTAAQLVVSDFRLSRRRIGPGERADGVVEFERPPYKRSNETLLLQMAESGAVDSPVLVPIGFGVSTLKEALRHDQ